MKIGDFVTGYGSGYWQLIDIKPHIATEDYNSEDLHWKKDASFCCDRKNPNAVYACVRLEDGCWPSDVRKQAICISGDIGNSLCSVAEVCKNCLLS